MKAPDRVESSAFFAKLKEINSADPGGARGMQVARVLREFTREDEWFKEHCPRCFARGYTSELIPPASAAVRELQRLARAGNRDAIGTLARLTVEMVNTLTQVSKVGSNAELLKRLARKLPAWPMLVARNSAGNNHLPLALGELELGKDCPINVSEASKASLEIPLNRLLWKCLRHFEDVHGCLRGAMERGKSFEDAIRPLILLEIKSGVTVGLIEKKDIPIYRRSLKLLRLSKRNVRTWITEAILPLIQSRFSKEIPQGKRGPLLGEFRKKLNQQLKQLAPKLAKTPLS